MASASLWIEAHNLDNRECVYCGTKEAELCLDHMIPKRYHGPTVIQNCVMACRSCNSRKGGRAPYEAKMMPRFGRFRGL